MLVKTAFQTFDIGAEPLEALENRLKKFFHAEFEELENLFAKQTRGIKRMIDSRLETPPKQRRRSGGYGSPAHY